MQKITNITHISLDGALCTILLMKRFPEYKLLNVPVPMNRIDQVCQEAVNNWSKTSIVLVTGVNPSPEVVAKFTPGMKVFTRFSGRIKGMPGVATGIPEELTADLLLRTVCRGVPRTKELENFVRLTRDYETYELKHRSSMGLNYLFKNKYRFEEYVERFKDGFSGFTDDEKTYIVQKEKEVQEICTQTDNLIWCGKLGKKNIAITPSCDYPNEIAKHIYTKIPYADIVILLNHERKHASVRYLKTPQNTDLGTTLEVFLTTYVSLSGKANNKAGMFTWTEREENSSGLPSIFDSFLKYDPELGKDNFEAQAPEPPAKPTAKEYVF